MSSYDPLDTLSQEAIVADAAEKQRLAELLAIADFKWIVANKRGRRFVWGLLVRAGVFRLSFTADPLRTAFNEGQRNEGLKVWAMLQEHTPEAYSLMISEHKATNDD
jgi:hypothetical protein